jgi:MFS family permease
MATEEISLAVPSSSRCPDLIYYGWINVVMGALAMTATLPGRTHGLGLITKPLLIDLQMSEMEFGYLNGIAILLGTLVAWPIVWLIDRWGTRLVGGMVIVALGASVVGMSFAHEAIPLFLGLLGVRALGQGALSVAATAMVGKWFARRIGLAMGVFAMLLGIGFVASTPSFQYAVEQYGWRVSWRWLGLSLLCGLGPLTLLLVRSAPPPGTTEIQTGESPGFIDNWKDATLIEALSTPAFWVYSIASSVFGLTWSAIMLFYQAILEERGFGSDTYRCAMAIFVGVGLVANLVGGCACRYWPMGRLLGLGLFLLAAALGLFPLVSSQTEVVAFTAVFGASGGIITVVYFAFYGRAFGQRELGRIQGAAHVLSVFASAIGPVLLTWTRDEFGSYDVFFEASAPIMIFLGMAAWWVPVPRRAIPQPS